MAINDIIFIKYISLNTENIVNLDNISRIIITLNPFVRRKKKISAFCFFPRQRWLVEISTDFYI